jgi:hypothetical protein
MRAEEKIRNTCRNKKFESSRDFLFCMTLIRKYETEADGKKKKKYINENTIYPFEITITLREKQTL